jgi:hypothetical protein
MRFDSRFLSSVRELLTPKTIVNRGVFEPLINLTANSVDQSPPGLALSSVEAGMDCDKKVAAVSGLIGLVVGGVTAGVVVGTTSVDGNPIRNNIGTSADVVGLGVAFGTTVGTLWGAFGCKAPKTSSSDPNANATSIDQLVFGEKGVVTDGEMNELLDSVSGPAADEAGGLLTKGLKTWWTGRRAPQIRPHPTPALTTELCLLKPTHLPINKRIIKGIRPIAIPIRPPLTRPARQPQTATGQDGLRRRGRQIPMAQ